MNSFMPDVHVQVTKDTKVTFNDIKGIDDAKQELMEVVEYLKNPQRFEKMGARLPKGSLCTSWSHFCRSFTRGWARNRKDIDGPSYCWYWQCHHTIISWRWGWLCIPVCLCIFLRWNVCWCWTSKNQKAIWWNLCLNLLTLNRRCHKVGPLYYIYWWNWCHWRETKAISHRKSCFRKYLESIAYWIGRVIMFVQLNEYH